MLSPRYTPGIKKSQKLVLKYHIFLFTYSKLVAINFSHCGVVFFR